MPDPRVDVFSGAADRDAILLESVEGLDADFERTKEHASENVANICFFSMGTHKVSSGSIPYDMHGRWASRLTRVSNALVAYTSPPWFPDA
jgi:hypothetical protein